MALNSVNPGAFGMSTGAKAEAPSAGGWVPQGLIQGDVDHTVQLGCRVRTTPEDLETLRADFAALEADGAAQFDHCVLCNRAVTTGDFGLDHFMFFKEGDEQRLCALVRTVPRIWCTPCAVGRAKQLRKPRLKSRKEHGFLAQWREVADKINEDREASNANPEPELDESVKAAWAPLLAPLEELRFEAKGIVLEVTAAAPVSENTLRICFSGTAPAGNVTAECTGLSHMLLDHDGKLSAETIFCDAVIAEDSVEPKEAEVFFAKTDMMLKLWNKKFVPLHKDKFEAAFVAYSEGNK